MAVLAVAGSPAVVVIGLALAGVGLMVRLVGDNYSIPLTVRLRLGWVAVVGIAYQFTLCAGYVILVLVGAGVVPLLAVVIVASAVQLVGIAVLVRREVSIVPAFDLPVWRRLLRETLPFAAAAAVGVVYFREALVLMSFLSNGRETGYYSAAFKIVEVLTTVPWILAASGLPILARAARDDSTRLSYAVKRLFEVGLILGVWMSASTIVGARLGIDVVAGAKFHASVGVLEIQALAIVTSFVAAILGYALLSMRQYRQLLRANVFAVLVVTVLSFILIPRRRRTRRGDSPDGRRGLPGARLRREPRPQPSSPAPLAAGRPGLAVGLGVALAVVYALPVSSELVRLVALAAVYFPAAVRAEGDSLRGRRRSGAPRQVDRVRRVPSSCRVGDARRSVEPRLQPGGRGGARGGRSCQPARSRGTRRDRIRSTHRSGGARRRGSRAPHHRSREPGRTDRPGFPAPRGRRDRSRSPRCSWRVQRAVSAWRRLLDAERSPRSPTSFCSHDAR